MTKSGMKTSPVPSNLNESCRCVAGYSGLLSRAAGRDTVKHSGEVAAAAQGMRGDRKAEAGASAGLSGRFGGVNE